jgi:hypothetical protein
MFSGYPKGTGVSRRFFPGDSSPRKGVSHLFWPFEGGSPALAAVAKIVWSSLPEESTQYTYPVAGRGLDEAPAGRFIQIFATAASAGLPPSNGYTILLSKKNLSNSYWYPIIKV